MPAPVATERGENSSVSHQVITTDRQLVQFCQELSTARRIAFDTEFVSERTYRPQLCLVQVAVDDRLAVIDTLAVRELRPFWELLAQGDHETIVHAGREEVCFSLDCVGVQPARLFDVQIAAGLIGLEYPAGYSSIVFKLLRKAAAKHETRTDWQRRPLSERQIDYALDDVRHLPALRDLLHQRLERLGRLDWLEAEMSAWLQSVVASRDQHRWRRVSGSAGLGSRELAIVRALWRWRESEAERRNCPVRKLLRDDLIVELAKRRSADERHIRSVRGLDRGDLQRQLPALSRAIAEALALPDGELPRNVRRESNSNLSMVSQFLASALTSICRAAQVAPSMVGTASDVRELIADRLGQSPASIDAPPVLTQGWRAEVVGNLLDELLQGKVSIRIEDPTSEQPLVFEKPPGNGVG